MSKAKDRLLAERIAHERELRTAEKAAVDHEREMRSLYDQHEREMRTANEAAVDKARSARDEVIEVRLQNLNHFAERMESLQQTFMPIDRFEREHSSLRERYEREHHALIERHVRDISVLSEKVDLQEKVTVRQDTTQALLDQATQSHRWQIGISIGLIGLFISSGLSLTALLLHLAGAY